MKKNSLIGLALMLLLSFGYYQYGLFTEISYVTAWFDIRNGRVEILTYGLAIYNDDEANNVAAKYGFQFRRVAGCVVTQRFINQVDSYNAAVENHLDNVNGTGWEDRFVQELDSLLLKY